MSSDQRSAYMEKLRDPRWQRMRLEVMQRDDWTCQMCGETEHTLNVHHRDYEQNREPWDYPLDLLVTLCESCHEIETHSRPLAEAKLVKSLRRVLDHRGLVGLICIFEPDEFMNPTTAHELVVSVIGNEPEIIEHSRHLSAERNRRCAPLTEACPQEREATIARQLALVKVLDQWEAAAT